MKCIFPVIILRKLIFLAVQFECTSSNTVCHTSDSRSYRISTIFIILKCLVAQYDILRLSILIRYVKLQ